jgi:hypothetical protein
MCGRVGRFCDEIAPVETQTPKIKPDKNEIGESGCFTTKLPVSTL